MSKITATFFLVAFLASTTNALVKQCPGYEDSQMVFINGTVPDVIYIPGSFDMSMFVVVKEDGPEDLYMGLEITRLDPDLEVPCVDGIGSCPYDLCQIIDNFPAEACAILPQDCSCPLLANNFDLKGLPVEVPDFGPLTPLMIGSYVAKAVFYPLSDPSNELGCIEFDFTFAQA
ncbi:hypothetical protein TCAL_08395 [Tigriopus californicus]|uniref:MD-2-related lipid-recognition domain-containing protein n=1 Tax=Tigriopus californicus TaxID=6832 RepID=A0A553N6V3_TIGCA|nr:ganglioside GM2 activator-like [Tigriopus californicus]XP_059088318.1 ganglioside GM2 activator-like [Tigriopus californicus]TRY61165.1 hypothetical protein TCAL_08395 [Tigriopus californicus]|eukprot:TCALIF_08395-PA protein Name:"Similar to Gm2a Ganglioside GM2 activator (Mus musculus)" AED:0.06 eAED:0.00 QI:39/1/0.33/1/1/1/3/0/173